MVQAKTESDIKPINKTKTSVVDPIASMTGDTTICPGNTAIITITATPNSIVIIQDLSTPTAYSIAVSASGIGTFSTPVLYQTTTYSLIEVREIATGLTSAITGVTVTITVVPNGCASVNVNINTTPNDTSICSVGECRTLTATVTPIPSTTSYEVSSIPYCPQAPFSEPGNNQLNLTIDDIWSSPITLPFNFCFFNNNYSTCQVGTNGVISFNNNASPGFCQWSFNASVPTPGFPILNAIYGIYQDLNPSVAPLPPAVTSVNWKLTGIYPCRKLIVNYSNIAQYSCGNSVGLQTSQIVLYEVSNIIEVYIQRRQSCTAWNSGSGVVGIQNASGTIGYVPAGRNTGNWTANNEAWRFTPNGPNVPVSVRWLENGNTIANGPTVVVCPTVTTSYIAQANYIISGVPFVVNSPENLITVTLDQTQSPADISVCYDASGNYTADLTTNNPVILGTENPVDYDIFYFTSLADAQIIANPIANPIAFSYTQNQTIYAGVYYLSYGCYYIKPFQILISEPVNAPSGLSPQTLNTGQTLSSLVVVGQNIQWYDASQGGNLLPNDTVAQNNVTYFASQAINNCESRSTQSSRLPILVQLSLGIHEFDNNAFNFYPNPTSDVLTITSSLANVKLEVFNTLSQKIENRFLESGTNIFNLGTLSSGIYLFTLSLEGKTKTYKIAKN